MTTINTSTNFDQLNIGVYQWPITIEGGAPNAPIKIKFKSDITFTSADNYFIVNTDNVQFDGKCNHIYIANVENYMGLIQNGTYDYDEQIYIPAFSNIVISNINISSSNSTLLMDDEDFGNGWLCRAYFGNQATNNFIIKSKVQGDLNDENCGGFCGEQTAANGGNLVIEDCVYTGTINAESCGGIIGASANYNGGTIFITRTISNAIINAEESAGFLGENACACEEFSPTFRHIGTKTGIKSILNKLSNSTEISNIITGKKNNTKNLSRDIPSVEPIVSPLDSMITISGCIFNGSLNISEDDDDYDGSSGFVGPYSAEPVNSTINIFDSIFNGDINAPYSAGFIGRSSALFGTVNLVSNIYNGNIYANDSSAFSGGFIGMNTAVFGSASVQNCRFNGYINQPLSGGIIAPFCMSIYGLDNDSDYEFDSPTGNIFLSGCAMTGIIDGEFIGGIVGGYLGFIYYDVEGDFNNTNNGTFLMENCIFAGEIAGLYSAGLIAGTTLDNTEEWVFDNVTIKNCKSKCDINEVTCVPLIGPGLPENFYVFTNSHNNIVINTYDFGTNNLG